MRSIQRSSLTRSFLAVTIFATLGGSPLKALDNIIDPCLDPLEDCWGGPVIEIPVDLPLPGDDTEEPVPGLGPFIAKQIDPSLIEILRRAGTPNSEGDADGDNDSDNNNGGGSFTWDPSIRFRITQEEEVAAVYGDISGLFFDDEARSSRSTHNSPYGPLVVRILGRDIVIADCEGIAGPPGGNDDVVGDGGGAMQMGLHAQLLVEVRHLDEGFAVRFPLQVSVCESEARLRTAYRRVNVRRPFRRGVLGNEEDGPQLNDAVQILSHLFLGGPTPECQEAADVDGDGEIALRDAVGILDFAFRGGDAPAEPFTQKGFGNVNSELPCEQPEFDSIVAERETLPDLSGLLDELLNPNACTELKQGFQQCIDGFESVCLVENGIGSWVPISPEQPCTQVGGSDLPILDTETPSGD